MQKFRYIQKCFEPAKIAKYEKERKMFSLTTQLISYYNSTTFTLQHYRPHRVTVHEMSSRFPLSRTEMRAKGFAPDLVRLSASIDFVLTHSSAVIFPSDKFC